MFYSKAWWVGASRVTLAVAILAASTAGPVLVPTAAQGAAAVKPVYAPGEVLVKFREGLPAVSLRSVQGQVPGLSFGRMGRTPVELWKLPEDVSVEETVVRLRQNSLVEYAEPNWRVVLLGRVIPDDPQFNLQWHLDSTPVSFLDIGGVSYPVDADMDAPEGWDLLGSAYWDTRTETVGVLDSGSGTSGFMSGEDGYQTGHEDLPTSQIFRNAGEILDGIDNDGNGYIDDLSGWDWLDSDNIPADSNPGDNSHGTFISGITSARWGNGIGVAGATRNIIKVLPLRGSFVSDLISGIGYAADLADRGERVHVLNASWYIPAGPVQALEDAIIDAGNSGLLFVAAAGNSESDNDLVQVYPSSYGATLPNVLSVAATDPTGDLADFSNYGLNSVRMSAPGDSIVSTWTGSDTYAVGGGTSFAAPIAASTAALIFAGQPGVSPENVVARLEAGGDFDERLIDRLASARRVNLAGALAPFYPFSGPVDLDSMQQLSLYGDSASTSFGSITGGWSTDDGVAVLVGDALSGWAISPVGPGIATFTLSFGSSSSSTGSYETGPWRVTAVKPFSGVLEVNQYVDFDAVDADGSSLGWVVEALEGTGVGTVNSDSGFFVARSPGRVRVALSRDNVPYDHSGPLRVLPTFNQPPAVTITGGPAGIVNGSSASFTWSGADPDGFVAGYFISLDTPTDPDIWTTLTMRTETGLTGGDHIFYVRAVDDNDAVSDVSSYPFTVDEPPVVTITSGPSGSIAISTATFQWSGSDPDGTVAGYYYSLDDPSPTTWTTETSHTFNGLSTGAHTFYVKSEGNLGGQSAVASLSFEVVAPSGGGGNGKCFITSVMAGTPLAARLPELREFRNRYLKTNRVGRLIIRKYYEYSPYAADFIRQHEGWKTAARWAMAPVVYAVKLILVNGKYKGSFMLT
jgi:hypothetical protein